MLLLSDSDIEQLTQPGKIVDAVKEAMLVQEEGNFVMPDRMHVDYEQNTLLLMPSFVKDKFATKLVSLFPDNKENKKPTIIGLVILNDGKTGEPKAILNGAKLTSVRTAAVSGIGFELFNNNSIKSIGLIGTGVQGLQQAYFATSIIDPDEIWIYDLYQSEHSTFIEQLINKTGNSNIKDAKSSVELLEKSQLVITATSSEIPVLPGETSLLYGKKIISIGSYKPLMRELPDELFPLLDSIYVDTLHALHETGDIMDPVKHNVIQKEAVITIGSVLQNPELRSKSETELYKTVGMGLFDLFVAELFYQEAISKNIGTEVSI